MSIDEKYRWTVRMASAVLGFLLLATAILADKTGLSAPGVGRGQIIIALSGLLLIVFSICRNVGRVYRTVAVILLNTVVLAVLFELAATGVYMVRARASVPVQGGRSDPHARAFELLRANYAPFVVWKEVSHEGADFTIDSDRRRIVTGASQDPDAFEVFMFGGSTMIGWGVPDSLTIPSIMQRRLACSLTVPVRVVNFGQQAYVSTQELIELMLQLRSGRRPDLVIFYDGINDTFAALQTGVPGVHQNLGDIAARYAGTVQPISLWESLAEKSNLVSLAREVFDGAAASDAAPSWSEGNVHVDVDSLSEGIVSAYAGNCGIVRTLGEGYGFGSAFFWQPYLGSGGGGRVLSEAEQRVADVMEEGDLAPLLEATYSRTSALSESAPGFADISGCLDGCPDELFEFGDFCHINAEGNAMVVEAMMEELISAGAIPDSLLSGPACGTVLH